MKVSTGHVRILTVPVARRCALWRSRVFLREGSLAGRMPAKPRGPDELLLRSGVHHCRRVAALFAAGCQLALRLRVGVVDPRAKRRFWD